MLWLDYIQNKFKKIHKKLNENTGKLIGFMFDCISK